MGKRREMMAASAPPRLARGLLFGGLAAVGGWMAYSALVIDHDVPLPPAIDAAREPFAGPGGRQLNVYADRSGNGRPLVLVHSINAAASAYEMRPLFERYRGRRPVFALDLPGFGFSERADRVYTPRLFKEAILDLLRQKVGEPADVIALSLGSEFAAQAALEAPDLVHSLTLISPSGFTRREKKRASQQTRDSGTGDAVHRIVSFPLWSQAFYDLLATRRSIHWYLAMSFVGPVDAGLEAYAYQTAHQPGAQHAPLYFISGKLFTPDIRERVYERLTQPVLVLYDRDPYVTFDTLPETLARRPNWRAVRVAPTRGLPQFEQMEAVAAALDAFWSEEHTDLNEAQGQIGAQSDRAP